MKTGDYCIVPYHDVFYTGTIKSDYYFDLNSQKFEHQRKVKWLFDEEPFSRNELPEIIQASLKSQLGLVDITKHESLNSDDPDRRLKVAIAVMELNNK